MMALLRADWLRFRRRRDFLVILIAVCVFAAVSFLAGYRGEVDDPTYPGAEQIRQEARDFLFFEGTPEEIAAQIDQYVTDQLAQMQFQMDEWERTQAVELPKYAFPQSIFTTIGAAIVPLLALILLASLAVGDEFRFGTIRTSLLAAGDRRRFLAARLLTIVAMTVGLYFALAAIGALFGAALSLGGADLGNPAPAVDTPSAVAWLAAQVLITLSVIGLAIAMTLLLRSGALPVLLIIIAGFIELFVANLPVFGPNELLAGIPQALLSTNIRTLLARLSIDTHAVAFSRTEVPFQAIQVPVLAVAAIVAAWGVLFLLLADRRLRTMDVVE